MNAARELLVQLAAHDEQRLDAVVSRAPDRAWGLSEAASGLSRGTRAMVELGALLATGAAATSVRWAVDRAAATGVDDRALVQVLLAAAGPAGSARTVLAAERLALAIDFDPAA